VDTKFLFKHHNTWCVVVEIPKALRERAGKARLKQSLKTDSLAEANRLKHTVVSEFQRQIRALKVGSTDPDAELFRLAAEFRTALDASDKRWQEDAQGREWSEYEEELDRLRDKAKEVVETHGPEVASRFFKAGKGEATFLKDQYPTWLGEVEHAGQTKAQHTAAIKSFMAWSNENVTIEETDRRKAGEYVSYLLKSSGLSRTTVRRHVSSLSSLWRWFVGRGLADQNVWRDQQLGKKTQATFRRGLDDEAILKLLRGAYSTPKYAQVLHDLLRLALLTGARIEELCALKRADVEEREDGLWLIITGGKTEAAKREIPLHELAKPIVERRMEGKDEYLFKGLPVGGPDEKRSWHVTKAYGRFRKQKNVDVSGSGQDFHALRNTFISMMEGAGAPESTVKLLVGHKRSSITYGHYSKGERVALRNVIEMLDYEPKIMEALSSVLTR
jgi:integrase